MLYADYEFVLDGVSSDSAWVYSKNVNVKDFRQILVYAVEDDANNVMIKIEGRAAQHTKSSWKDILAATNLTQATDVIFESESHTLTTQAETLDSAWLEIRIGILDSVGTGRVYAWVNKRRR